MGHTFRVFFAWEWLLEPNFLCWVDRSTPPTATLKKRTRGRNKKHKKIYTERRPTKSKEKKQMEKGTKSMGRIEKLYWESKRRRIHSWRQPLITEKDWLGLSARTKVFKNEKINPKDMPVKRCGKILKKGSFNVNEPRPSHHCNVH